MSGKIEAGDIMRVVKVDDETITVVMYGEYITRPRSSVVREKPTPTIVGVTLDIDGEHVEFVRKPF